MKPVRNVMHNDQRVYLSPPFQSGDESRLVQEALDSNWIAPLGPMVDAFEEEFRGVVRARHAIALSSGTAGLHLALVALGVGPGDEVATSTLTFAATAFAIRYVGATPVFIDSDAESWNLDATLLTDWLERRARVGRVPKVVLPVHLYGQSCDMDRIRAACARWGVALIEDAAEALGATYGGGAPGEGSRCAVWSFNGNKIITTSGGGMVTSDDHALVERMRKLASQAREARVHYEHAEIGYNYRLSNVSAAIGRAQLRTLDARVAARRAHYNAYHSGLMDIPGFSMATEMPWGRHTRWLSCCLIDAAITGRSPEQVRLALEAHNIEARPVWKPMHEQPVFRDCERVGGDVASRLFREGLCLPSGTGMTAADRERTIAVIRSALLT